MYCYKSVTGHQAYIFLQLKAEYNMDCEIYT